MRTFGYCMRYMRLQSWESLHDMSQQVRFGASVRRAASASPWAARVWQPWGFSWFQLSTNEMSLIVQLRNVGDLKAVNKKETANISYISQYVAISYELRRAVYRKLQPTRLLRRGKSEGSFLSNDARANWWKLVISLQFPINSSGLFGIARIPTISNNTSRKTSCCKYFTYILCIGVFWDIWNPRSLCRGAFTLPGSL